MFAEVMTGIALVKQSVDFIKSNINTVQDIGQITEQIENLFVGEEQLQKKRGKKAGVTLRDQFGIKSVAQEVIDAKLAAEALNEMRNLVDMRFGHGTWQSIVDLRAKRIQEEREALQELKRAKVKEQKEFEEMMKNGILIFLVCAVMVSSFGFVIYLASS